MTSGKFGGKLEKKTATNHRLTSPLNMAGKHPPNPAYTSSWFSRFFFLWVGQIMKRRGKLTESDLFELHVDDTTEKNHERLSLAWQRELQSASTPNLPRAFLRAFLAPYLVWSILIVAKSAFLLAQTQFLARLLDRLAEPALSPSEPEDLSAYMWALALVLGSVITVLLHQWYFFSTWRAGMRWKAASAALIFEKAVALRQDSLAAVSVGQVRCCLACTNDFNAFPALRTSQVVSLLSNDLEKFGRLSQFLIWVVLTPLESVAAGVLLSREVGWEATLACFALLLMFIGLQVTVVASCVGILGSCTFIACRCFSRGGLAFSVLPQHESQTNESA